MRTDEHGSPLGPEDLTELVTLGEGKFWIKDETIHSYVGAETRRTVTVMGAGSTRFGTLMDTPHGLHRYTFTPRYDLEYGAIAGVLEVMRAARVRIDEPEGRA